ncbi:CRISP [Lepeophtheirus salmonis]|uniref:CRISP n=1 Tax=Lepeophtheirus salmonis TaxID=72036 RepID=A0A7R8H972_LEPSM|nr:CRISP [Lepeophtheirus salmonis]CAF2954053.1 CRISP [Lepeophtheirus salmonis]
MALADTDYCKIGNEHTLCSFRGKISKDCGKYHRRTISKPSEQNEIVKIHNEFRSKIANGSEYENVVMPPASNMMEIEWDYELQLLAQTWVDQCKLSHDCISCRNLSRFEVGQNLFKFGTSLQFDDSWEHILRIWYSQKEQINTNFIKSYKLEEKTSDFSQMIWARTTKVGCAMAKFISPNSKWTRYFFVCNYGERGSIDEAQIYREGKPCAQCPTGCACSKKYEGLCSFDPKMILHATQRVIRPHKYGQKLSTNYPNKRSKTILENKLNDSNVNVFINEKYSACSSNETLNGCKKNKNNETQNDSGNESNDVLVMVHRIMNGFSPLFQKNNKTLYGKVEKFENSMPHFSQINEYSLNHLSRLWKNFLNILKNISNISSRFDNKLHYLTNSQGGRIIRDTLWRLNNISQDKGANNVTYLFLNTSQENHPNHKVNNISNKKLANKDASLSLINNLSKFDTEDNDHYQIKKNTPIGALFSHSLEKNKTFYFTKDIINKKIKIPWIPDHPSCLYLCKSSGECMVIDEETNQSGICSFSTNEPICDRPPPKCKSCNNVCIELETLKNKLFPS